MMNLTIIVNDKIHSETQIFSISLTTTKGRMEIMENHSDGFFELKDENVIVKNNTNEIKKLSVEKGMVSIFNQNCIKLLCTKITDV